MSMSPRARITAVLSVSLLAVVALCASAAALPAPAGVQAGRAGAGGHDRAAYGHGLALRA